MKPVSSLLGIMALLALGGTLWVTTRPAPLTVQGEVSADRVDVSPRVSGRVKRLLADTGQDIASGALLLELENPQLETALFAAEAALGVARADLDRINSIRPETVAARRAEMAAAQADVIMYREAYSRQAQLVRSGNTPQARLDEAVRNLDAAQRKQESADATLQLAIQGASKEERALAAAQLKQAEAVLEQRRADMAELALRAPVDGQVTTRIAEPGENFSPGSPVFTLIDMRRLWFTFNLREDLLEGLQVGSAIEVSVPALGNRRIPLKVTLINVQGQYATWRATRATGDFDLRTFEVRAQAALPVEGLRPGMSAIALWNTGSGGGARGATAR